MTSVSRPTPYWWDKDAIQLLEKYRPQHFRKLDIWNLSWSNIVANNELIEDPRSFLEKVDSHFGLEKLNLFFILFLRKAIRSFAQPLK